MEKQGWEMPTDVLAVHKEIEEWRKNRDKRGPIPSSIWLAASRLTKRYSMYHIAQALRLNYGALKRRILENSNSEGESRIPQTEKDSAKCCEFVELPGISLTEAKRSAKAIGGNGESFQLEIEVSDGLGSQMTVRVLERGGIDVSQLISTFWSRSR